MEISVRELDEGRVPYCKTGHVRIDLGRSPIRTLRRIVQIAKGTWLRSTDDESPISSVDHAGMNLGDLWREDAESVVGVHRGESHG